MNDLEQYLKKLDGSAYDHRDSLLINREFQELAELLLKKGQPELAGIADLDRQVFSVQKSFDTKLDTEKGTITGLSWQMSGTQTLEDGSQVPLYWPNVANYKQADFEYFEKRYKDSNNLYLKTEYGLMIYFGSATVYSKHNDFKKQLANELFDLSKGYLKKAQLGGENKYYSQDFFRSLNQAFNVAEKSKLEPELSFISKFIFEIHQGWDVTKEGTLRILLDLSGLMVEFFGVFKKLIDFKKVSEKNMEGAKELEKTHLWGALYAVDRNIAIAQKENNSPNTLLFYKAELYEKLAKEAESRYSLASITFAENALRIYEQIKELGDVKRLEEIYTDLRGKFQLSEIRQELPKEYVEDLNNRITKTVSESNELEILNHFILCPWYQGIENIKNQAIETSKQSVLMSILPASIVDKFGNTIDVFYTEDEKAKFNFWNSFTFSYQMGTQTMHAFFNEAYKSGKLNYNSTLKYLEGTWYNEPIVRSYHGQTIEVKPIDTLKPGLKKMFEELDNFAKNKKYQCDFVTITDSLTLKVEGLLRYFCEKLGIATFKTRQKGPDKLVMEKLIDDLLADLAHEPDYKPEQETNFDEDDRVFIKYVMSEKAGLNLRNVVAHSLLDIHEYSFELVLVLFCIILRLSKYKFEDLKTDTKDETNTK